MGNFRAIFIVQDLNSLRVEVLDNKKMIYDGTLTVSQDFDIVLIRALDKIFRKNKIDRLSLKSVEIGGKMAQGIHASDSRISVMILKTVIRALIT